MASFFKCWSHLFYAIVDRFLTSTTNKKNQMRPGLKTSVFFLFLFFFLCFVLLFFFPQICIKGRKKVSSGKDSSPQKLYRHMFLENVLSALFTFTQHSFVQYVWYSHSPLVKTYHVKEYSPALNRTQISKNQTQMSKIGQLCLKLDISVRNQTLLSKIGHWCLRSNSGV